MNTSNPLENITLFEPEEVKKITQSCLEAGITDQSIEKIRQSLLDLAGDLEDDPDMIEAFEADLESSIEYLRQRIKELPAQVADLEKDSKPSEPEDAETGPKILEVEVGDRTWPAKRMCLLRALPQRGKGVGKAYCFATILTPQGEEPEKIINQYEHEMPKEIMVYCGKPKDVPSEGDFFCSTIQSSERGYKTDNGIQIEKIEDQPLTEEDQSYLTYNTESGSRKISTIDVKVYRATPDYYRNKDEISCFGRCSKTKEIDVSRYYPTPEGFDALCSDYPRLKSFITQESMEPPTMEIYYDSSAKRIVIRKAEMAAGIYKNNDKLCFGEYVSESYKEYEINALRNQLKRIRSGECKAENPEKTIAEIETVLQQYQSALEQASGDMEVIEPGKKYFFYVEQIKVWRDFTIKGTVTLQPRKLNSQNPEKHRDIIFVDGERGEPATLNSALKGRGLLPSGEEYTDYLNAGGYVYGEARKQGSRDGNASYYIQGDIIESIKNESLPQEGRQFSYNGELQGVIEGPTVSKGNVVNGGVVKVKVHYYNTEPCFYFKRYDGTYRYRYGRQVKSETIDLSSVESFETWEPGISGMKESVKQKDMSSELEPVIEIGQCGRIVQRKRRAEKGFYAEKKELCYGVYPVSTSSHHPYEYEYIQDQSLYPELAAQIAEDKDKRAEYKNLAAVVAGVNTDWNCDWHDDYDKWAGEVEKITILRTNGEILEIVSESQIPSEFTEAEKKLLRETLKAESEDENDSSVRRNIKDDTAALTEAEKYGVAVACRDEDSYTEDLQALAEEYPDLNKTEAFFDAV